MKKIIFLLFLVFSISIHANEILLIGIAGGTGAGKTTIAKKLYQEFTEQALIICQDNYYKDLSHLTLDQRKEVNFDHPDSIDFDLLIQDLQTLKENKSVAIPTYDFKTHSRIKDKILLEPKKVIIVEGILLFSIPNLRELFDVKIFVDTDDDLRLLRRIIRDINERGRDVLNIRDQYLATVHPMHWEFVEPSKRFADFILPSSRENEIGLQVVIDYLKTYLRNEE